MSALQPSRRARLVRAVASTLALVVLLLPRAVHAQAVTGTIFGTVTDNSGAVMPGVTVTVTNVDTSRGRTYVTDGNGEYAAPSVQTGTYKVGAELQGFKTLLVEGITVSVDQRVRVDVKLELGNMSETVEIVARTPLVQPNSSDLATTVEEEQIKALPLNGRNFVSLTRTIPGVMRGLPGSNIDGAGSLAWRAAAAFSAEFGRSLGGVRQPADQVGRQRLSRQRLRVLP